MNRTRIYCALIPVLMFLFSSINFSQNNTDYKKLIEARLNQAPINKFQIPKQPAEDKKEFTKSKKSLNPTQYLLRTGSWPYGPSHSVAVDSINDIIYLGSGGAVLVLDGTDPANPVLITDAIRTNGLVEDIFIDLPTNRLYLACGEGGYEIWNVEDPPNPYLYSRNEILYYDVETPVEHVQVTGNFAIFECSWGYVHSVNVSDPYNPYQVSFSGLMGNPAHDIHIDQYGYIHATGQQAYDIYYLDASGHLYSAGGFPLYSDAVFGGSQASYVGQDDYLWIFYNGGYSSTDVGGLTHIEVRGNLAYIINNSGLHVWDVSNSDYPFQLGSIATDIYPVDLYVAGDYAYVSLYGYGFSIYNIRNPSNPVYVSNYNTYDATIDACIKGNYAYTACGNEGLSIIDISNPDYPELTGSISFQGYTTSVEVRDNTAFICGIDEGLNIVDISNPQNPTLISSSGNFSGSVLEAGDNLVFVTEVISTESSFIHVFDVSDINNPVEINSMEFYQIVRNMVYRNGYLFVPAYEDGMYIYDLSDPQNPVVVSHITLSKAYDVFPEGNLMYLTSSNWPSLNGGIHVYDISDLSSPAELGSYAADGFFPDDISVKGEYAYVTDGDEVWLFIIENNNPTFIERYDMPDLTSELFSVDEYIFIPDRDAGLYIMKNDLITNPFNYEWIIQESGITSEIRDVYMINQEKGFAAAQYGIILSTTNGGTEWLTSQVGLYGDNFECLNFTDDMNGWVGSASGKLFNTTDGGESWNEHTIPSTGALRDIEFVNESTGWIITLEDHYLFKTTDSGQTWNNQNSGLTGIYRYFDMDFADENTGYVMGAYTQNYPWTYFIIKTTDSGNNWSTIYSSQSVDLATIYFIDQNTGFTGGLFGDLFKTTDGGINWQFINNYGDIIITDICFLNNQNGWFTGSEGALYRTTNAGDTWAENDLLIPNYLRAIYFTDPENGWIVGNDGIILRTGNGANPVELVAFSASLLNGKVQLNWRTASEINNKGFEVQRTPLNLPGGETLESGEWKDIGFVDGNGTTTESNSYSFIDKEILSGQYQYRLKQIDYNGSSKYSNEVLVNVLIPAELSLEQNYPNPFNPSTTIEYSIPKAGKVSLKVYNILGGEVVSLVNEFKEAGNYKVNFNAGKLSSGIYYYRLKTNSYSLIKKMVLLK